MNRDRREDPGQYYPGGSVIPKIPTPSGGGGGGEDANAVHYYTEIKTSEQKAQARANIGAGTSNFSGNYGDLSGVPQSFNPSAHSHETDSWFVTAINAVKSLIPSLPSWLTSTREEPPTQAAVAAKYTKPTGGIPKDDLANGVQASLDKADTALQQLPTHTHTKSQITDFPTKMTPTAHASTHGASGSDPVTPSSIGAYTSGETDGLIETAKAELNARIDLVEATSHPNMSIVGNPTFTEGVVSGFSSTDYLMFPTDVNVGQNAVDFYMAFTTGANVTAQQNVLDSWCGIAFAVKEGGTVTAASQNGTTFVTATSTGTIAANSSYRLKLEFRYADGSYTVTTKLASGAGDYAQIGGVVTLTAPLHPTATYWGGANPTSGVHHVFGGSINLAECRMDWNGKTVWRGYTEVPTYHKGVREDGSPVDQELHDFFKESTGLKKLKNALLESAIGTMTKTDAEGSADAADATNAVTLNDNAPMTVTIATATADALAVTFGAARQTGGLRICELYILNGTASTDLTFDAAVQFVCTGDSFPACEAGINYFVFAEIAANKWKVTRETLKTITTPVAAV